MDYISKYTGSEIDALLDKSGQVHTAAAEAEAAKEAAETANSQAQTAKTDAQAASTQAQEANTAAQTAKTSAEAAAGTATTAKEAAETAKTAAETANANAQTAKAAAETAQAGAEESEGYVRDTYETVMSNIIEAPTRYSNALVASASGKRIDIATAEAPARSFTLHGETVVTPANPGLPISPDNVATIQSVGGTINLGRGKNLIRRTATFPQTKSGITITYDENRDEYTLNGTATEKVAITVTVKDISNKIGMFASANKYRAMGIWRVSGTNNGNIALYSDSSYMDGTNAGAQITTLNNAVNFAVSNYTKNRDTIGSVGISVDSGTTCTNLIVRIGAEINNAAVTEMTYEPYKGVTIPLKDTAGNPLELRCIRDSSGNIVAEDTVFKDTDGERKLRQNIKKYSYTAREDLKQFTYAGEAYVTGYFNFADRSYASAINIICNLLPTRASLNADFGIMGRTSEPNYVYVRAPIQAIGVVTTDTTAQAAEKLRNYLFPKNLEILYQPETPQTITLHPDTTTALEQASTMLPGRTILEGMDAVNPTIDVEYVRDINQAIYDRTESDQRHSNALIGKSAGEVINIPTAESRLLSLKVLGNTTVTPADPVNPISPDNPATIASVSGAVNVLKSGKNLIDSSFLTGATYILAGVTFTVNPNGSITANGTNDGTANSMLVISQLGKLKKGTYYLSGKDGNLNVRASYINDSGTYTYVASDMTFTIDKDRAIGTKFYVVVPAGASVANATVFPQLELGQFKTPFEKGGLSAIPIPLKDAAGNPVELRGIPATYNADGSVATWAARDAVFRDGDGWAMNPNVIRFALNGTETITVPSQNNNYIRTCVDMTSYIPSQNVGNQVLVLSDKFKANTANALAPLNAEGISNWYASTRSGMEIYISASRFSALGGVAGSITAQNVKNLLAAWYSAGNPLVVLAVAKSVTPIPLHPDTAAALEQLYPTYSGRTVLMGTDAVSPGWEVEYVQDINYYAQTQADMAGTLATRPTVGARIGQQYFATDQTPKRVYAWDGSEWIQIK